MLRIKISRVDVQHSSFAEDKFNGKCLYYRNRNKDFPNDYYLLSDHHFILYFAMLSFVDAGCWKTRMRSLSSRWLPIWFLIGFSISISFFSALQRSRSQSMLTKEEICVWGRFLIRVFFLGITSIITDRSPKDFLLWCKLGEGAWDWNQYAVIRMQPQARRRLKARPFDKSYFRSKL